MRPRVVSVGNRHDYPSDAWGNRDYAQAELEAHLNRDLNATPPVRPDHVLAANFGGLYGSTYDARRRESARSREIERRLANLGIRPRRR